MVIPIHRFDCGLAKANKREVAVVVAKKISSFPFIGLTVQCGIRTRKVGENLSKNSGLTSRPILHVDSMLTLIFIFNFLFPLRKTIFFIARPKKGNATCSATMKNGGSLCFATTSASPLTRAVPTGPSSARPRTLQIKRRRDGSTLQQNYQCSHPQPPARGYSDESNKRQRRLQARLSEAARGAMSQSPDARGPRHPQWYHPGHDRERSELHPRRLAGL